MKRTASDLRRMTVLSLLSAIVAVLAALGKDSDAPGTELIDELARLTGLKAPAALAGLKDKKVRFTGCTESEEMKKVVDDFLK